MNDRSFDSLQMLIDFYRRKAIVVGQSLREPVCKLSQSNLNLEEVSDEEAKSMYDELHKAMDSLQRKLLKETLHHGQLNLWTAETDSWMNVYMMLMRRNKNSRLYIYKTSQHIKHIAVLEISYAHHYECSNQLWIRPYCFQIFESIWKITTLQASNKESYQEWKKVLSECIIKPLSPVINSYTERLCILSPVRYFMPNHHVQYQLCSHRRTLYKTQEISNAISLWSTETKSWIDVSLKLRSGGSETKLLIYDATDNLNCKSVDLSNASIYKCHKSLWNRLYCFQIYVNTNREFINLSASNLESFKSCIMSLKRVGISQPLNLN